MSSILLEYQINTLFDSYFLHVQDCEAVCCNPTSLQLQVEWIYLCL